MNQRTLLDRVIDTQRLQLRSYRFSDASRMHAYLQEPDQNNYLEGAATTLSEAQVEAIIARHILANPEQRNVWAITIDDQPMGAVSINFEKESRIAEIGYHISKRLWGRGYASEAVAAVVHTAFGNLPQLQRIQASIHPENQASIRVAERVGMQYEGTLRSYAFVNGEPADEAIYAVLRGSQSAG
ncbi:MAG: GNAT family N-acetyltransferase [Pseudomonadales bacterium]